jgi:lipoprotein-releasing system ATP-binding protein
MNDVLVLNAVQKTYRLGLAGALPILRGINLRIAKGEAVALVAPSGAGKSTLLHIAGLLDSADAGQVIVNGRDMAGQADHVRTQARRDEIGFVYQFHHLLPEFNASENVILPQLAAGRDTRQARTRAAELLTQMGLKDRIPHRPSELSGGEQQRVAIARALANQPSLLLADEPTGNLDPKTSDAVFSALMEIVRNSKTGALIATHNYDLARKMDRILRLDNGMLDENSNV